ncbi:MAG: restriction endonuclease subunit S [Nostoc sp.]|uniref:restriction endonuclease subunit S n=1 Tax=Nostoc sp. TaxID=1180 RepID=UPI002FF6FE26
MVNTDLKQLELVNKTGKLSEEWHWKSLSYLARDTERINPSKHFPENTFKYVDIGSVDNHLGKIVKTQTLLGQQAPSRARKLIKADDIIIATTRPYLRNIAIVPLELNQAICSTGFCVLRANADIAVPKYVYYACRSNIVIKQLIPKQRGASYPAVTDNDIFESVIPVPFPDNPIRSLDIQRRIVARIEALLAEVKESRNLIYKIEQDAKRFLSVALDEVFTKLESVIDIVQFDKIATAFNGKAIGEGESSIRVFKSKHVYPHSLRLDKPSFMKVEQVPKIPKNRFLRPSDVLMANAAEGTLGRVTYVSECEEQWTVDGKIMILRSLDEQNLLLNKWLYYYLWSARGRQEILSRRTGTAFAENRGQTGISPKSVLEIPVPLPPINEQRQAVAYLDSIQHEADEILKLLEQDAKLLDMLEQSILERAFRGEL